MILSMATIQEGITMAKVVDLENGQLGKRIVWTGNMAISH